ncbi:hypothetical protein OC861_006963 [Tilletia horrida]|nr:hypothetical protein OC861_006963 [Tilletia horrida]
MATIHFKCPLEGCDYDRQVTRRGAINHWHRHGELTETFPIASQQGRHSTDPNTWLWQTIIARWNTLPSNHPQLAPGIALLHYLAAKKTPIHHGLTTNIHHTFSIEPTAIHLNTDVLNATLSTTAELATGPSLIASANSMWAADHNKAHFFHSMQQMASSSILLDSPEDLCAIINLPPSTDGLKACQLHLPDSVKSIGLPKTPVPEFGTAYTPRGHITDIHIDSLYEATITTTVLGRKLLLQRPASDYNLKILKRFHWTTDAWRLLSLYPLLQDIKVTFCEHGTVEHLPPGALHAVMALDNSAMVAYGLAHPRMLPDVLRVAKWELDHAFHLLQTGDHQNGIPSILASHKADLDIWIKLMNKSLMRPHQEQILALQQLVSDAREEFAGIVAF